MKNSPFLTNIGEWRLPRWDRTRQTHNHQESSSAGNIWKALEPQICRMMIGHVEKQSRDKEKLIAMYFK